ncbi:hypothetical protein K474DRAFT_1247431 [Panus rudis PR-1116 ss-1]|nr:hypothetical protein K474DRAFT_1247431 [Panus rudis PR-1116 ss-1]
MAVMESPSENEIMRIWNLLNEVSDQLSQNRSLSISLHSIAGSVKTQAIHNQTGFVLRRYNLDKSQEEYDAELERMNASMSAENQVLANDNKQLNALIKEYEETLQNIMATFRNRANEVQQRELAIIREYEEKLLVRETEELVKALEASTSQHDSLSRLGNTLRSMMRSLNGEDPEYLPEDYQSPDDPLNSHYPSTLSLTLPTGVNSLDLNESDVAERERQLAAAEWALEREAELARLERENEHLRRLLAEHNGINAAGSGTNMTGAQLPRLVPRSKAQAVVPAQTGNAAQGVPQNQHSVPGN